MATGSAWGISGYDPLMSRIEGNVNNDIQKNSLGTAFGFDKKMAKYNAKLSKELAEFNQALAYQSLQKTPGYTKQGLISAGYNPILAVTGGFNPTAFAGSASATGGSVTAPDLSGSSEGGFDSSAFAQQKAAVEAKELSMDILRAQSDEARSKATLAMNLASASQPAADEAMIKSDWITGRKLFKSVPDSRRVDYQEMFKSQLKTAINQGRASSARSASEASIFENIEGARSFSESGMTRLIESLMSILH